MLYNIDFYNFKIIFKSKQFSFQSDNNVISTESATHKESVRTEFSNPSIQSLIGREQKKTTEETEEN